MAHGCIEVGAEPAEVGVRVETRESNRGFGS